MKYITYSGAKTREISFPLGGIGTGCIGLLGNGRLADFELFGTPNKKSSAGFTFFAIKAEKNGKLVDARVLNTDSQGTRSGFDYYTDENTSFHCGYGYGPGSDTMAGVPHFPASDFCASFPFAKMDFSYEKFPGKVSMTAFNPFIPFNVPDSSIPAAFFEFEIENTTEENIDYTLCGVLENMLSGAKNTFDGDMKSNMKCIKFESVECKDDDGALDSTINVHNLCLGTDCEDVSYQEYWYRGTWYDSLQVFWDDFCKSTVFKNRHYDNPQAKSTGLIASHVTLKPHEKKTIRFIISWYVRFLMNYWTPIPKNEGESDEDFRLKNSWKNYYCRYFSGSFDCAAYCFNHWDRLKEETALFNETLFSSTLPDEVMDAVSANLAILKSSTILRHSDGNIIAFEGSQRRHGSCEGNCTHVYNYAYALAHLFPDLERGLRETEFRYSMDDKGAVNFRAQSPLGRRPKEYFPCVDGQMGGIFKSYREFKMTGDVEWLCRMWPYIKKSLDFTFDPENDFKWDVDRTGVMNGRQHNTLDTELYSPNSWLQGLYCAALVAAAEMADIVKDKKSATEYRELFEKAKKYLNDELYNGKYFYQKIDLSDRSLLEPFKSKNYFDGTSIYDYYWSDEHSEIKYQVGEGSSVDQMLGQWHANNIGLGEIFDRDKLMSALDTLYNVNFKKSMRDFFNPCRNFCINDESGVTICTYPEGAQKPKIPIPYAEECMNGFEYQAASLMIQSGMVKEGLEIVAAIRKRYDGEYRNPFAEMECGSSYVRSLASYTLLASMSGFEYDMHEGLISFNPYLEYSKDGYYKCFFAVGEAYGTVEVGPKYVELQVLKGELKIHKFGIFAEPKVAYCGGKKVDFDAEGNYAVFGATVQCNKEKNITLIFD